MSLIQDYILNRVHKKNKNFLGVICGQTGSGKSYSALRLGQDLDPNFDINNVAFSPADFMRLVRGQTKQLQRGSYILFDEIQVTLSAHDWQSRIAKIMNVVLQTFRHRNYIVMLTTPHFSFVNASTRKLLHAKFEMMDIDTKLQEATLKPLLIQASQSSSKIYYKYLRFNGARVTRLRLNKPTEEIISLYEAKRKLFTDKLNQNILEEMEALEETKPKVGFRKPLTALQEKVYALLNENHTQAEIATILDMNQSAISQFKRAIESKGYKIEKSLKNKPKNGGMPTIIDVITDN